MPIVATFQANFDQFVSEAAKANRALGGLQITARNVGVGLTAAITAPLVGIGALATKAAVDFESSFAGIRKTVDATEEEFAGLAQGLRNMAKEIPVNVNEFNRLGEAAGALGIPKEDIQEFTRVMALLGVTTNVTSDQAAESIAQIQTQFAASGTATANFASALVALGNDGASTEAQILALTARLASAGNAAGMSQADVLGFASAMANVGINAEAGGTALSQVFNKINRAVALGGDKLAAFAGISGLSVDQFKQKFETDAAGAVDAFIQGLGRVKGEGGNLILTLDELGFKEIRQSDTLRRLAANTQNVTDALALSRSAWESNSALTTEANERFKTFASQLEVFKNRLYDAGITLGTALLPHLLKLMEMAEPLVRMVSSVAEWFSQLPEPVQRTGLVIAALAAAIGPLVLAFSVVVGAIGPLVTAIGGTAGLTAVFSSLLPFLGPVGLIAGGLIALVGIWLKWGDDITRVAGEAMTGVKTWIVDFWEGSIFQSIARMLEAFVQLWWAINVKVIEAVANLMTAVKSWLLDKFEPLITAVKGLLDLHVATWRAVHGLVVPIVSDLYKAVKEWLLDKFQGIVDGIKRKIDAVTGFFRDMKDKVVGNSYVPDMLDGIQLEFSRLEPWMVEPTRQATTGTELLFGNLLDNLTAKLPSGLRSVWSNVTSDAVGFLADFSGKFGETFVRMFGTGADGLQGIIQTGLTNLGNLMFPGFGSLLAGLAPIIMEGLRKLGDLFASFFRSIWDGFKAIWDFINGGGGFDPGIEPPTGTPPPGEPGRPDIPPVPGVPHQPQPFPQMSLYTGGVSSGGAISLSGVTQQIVLLREDMAGDRAELPKVIARYVRDAVQGVRR